MAIIITDYWKLIWTRKVSLFYLPTTKGKVLKPPLEISGLLKSGSSMVLFSSSTEGFVISVGGIISSADSLRKACQWQCHLWSSSVLDLKKHCVTLRSTAPVGGLLVALFILHVALQFSRRKQRTRQQRLSYKANLFQA